MTKEILKDEILSAEQLNAVSDGSVDAVLGDNTLIGRLHYCGLLEWDKANWESQGWRVTKSLDDNNNTYQSWNKSKSEWQKMPRWYALGDLLTKANYWGFDKSKKGDSGYVIDFIDSHFGVDDVGAGKYK